MHSDKYQTRERVHHSKGARDLPVAITISELLNRETQATNNEFPSDWTFIGGQSHTQRQDNDYGLEKPNRRVQALLIQRENNSDYPVIDDIALSRTVCGAGLV